MKRLECFTPFENAWEKMERMLFSPFNWTLWLKLGFLAWLASLLEGYGAGTGFNIPDLSHSDSHAPAFGSDPDRFQVIAIIAAIFLVVLIVALAVVALILWVKARGRFMFIDGLLHGVEEPLVVRWRKFKSQGNSLFLFNIVATLALGLVALLWLGASAALLWKWVADCIGATQMLAPTPLAIGGMLAILALIPFSLISNFILSLFYSLGPLLMYKKGVGAWTAFKATLTLLCGHPWGLFKYWLSMVALQIVISIAVFAFQLLTCVLCCLGCIVMSTPFVWAVVCLPALVLTQLYSIEFASQIGGDFNLTAAEPESGNP